ncbi:MAG TPA: BrnA antitoxin family protein [Pseudolabrys sp.]|nr:BrnA antitoxin family protein [Pseudolabrys sp.]
MPRKKKSGAAVWVDSVAAPPLTQKFFDHEEIQRGEKILRCGRPPLSNPKQAEKLRLDADVLAAYRRTGRPHQCGLAEGEKVEDGMNRWGTPVIAPHCCKGARQGSLLRCGVFEEYPGTPQ